MRSRRRPLTAIEYLPPLPVEHVLAELGHDVREVDRYPVLDDLAVPDQPEIHAADLDPLPRWRNSHEFATVRGVPGAEAGPSFTHVEARLVDRDLVGERRLERREHRLRAAKRRDRHSNRRGDRGARRRGVSRGIGRGRSGKRGGGQRVHSPAHARTKWAQRRRLTGRACGRRLIERQ